MEVSGDEEEIIAAKKRYKRALFTAAILLIGLQTAWLIVKAQSATREVNELGSSFNEVHFFEVPDIFSAGKSMPVEFTCSNVIGEGNSSTEIWWTLHDDSNNIVDNWNGVSGGDCGGFSTYLSPGEYKITTSSGSGSEFHQELNLSVWSAFWIEGHIVALLIAALLGGDGIWRAKKKLKKLTTPLPQHKIAQKEAWEKVNTEMESKDRIEAEVEEMGFAGFVDQPSEKEYGKKIPELSDFDYTDEVEEEESPELDDLGEGTMKGLSGPVKRDDRIKRVGDIYDLMDD
tara:strand:+ start:275 stop:1135 length:861 start_codon:yes stop_codon:yes gene_type:complete